MATLERRSKSHVQGLSMSMLMVDAKRSSAHAGLEGPESGHRQHHRQPLPVDDQSVDVLFTESDFI